MKPIKNIKQIYFFSLHSIKISSPKNIKNYIKKKKKKKMRELKNLNVMLKKKKKKVIKINELEEDLRVEIVKRRMKEKAVSFKMKNIEVAGKKLELEEGIKAETIIKTEGSKLKILREVIEKQSLKN